MFLQKPMLGTQIDWSNPLNDGVVLDLLMNEGHGDVVHDLSGYGNHGTLNNMAFPSTQASGWNPGLDGVALAFDGTDDFIDCGNDESLNITDAITIEAWVKYTEQKDWGGLIVGRRVKSGDHLGYGYSITQRNAGAIIAEVSDGITAAQVTVNDINNDVWYHIVMTSNGSNLKIYKNGEFKNSVDYSFTAQSGGTTYIGEKWGTYYFNGAIDEVRIYNRALSADEIMQTQINPYGAYLQ